MFVGSFRLLQWFSCIPVPRIHSCRNVGVGNVFGQPLGVVAVACGITGGIGNTDEVAFG